MVSGQATETSEWSQEQQATETSEWSQEQQAIETSEKAGIDLGK
jgi:hypothetical protein